MKKKRNFIIACLLILALLTSFACASSQSNNVTSTLLFVTSNSDEASVISALNTSSSINIIEYDELQPSNFSQYDAIAMPYAYANGATAQAAFQVCETVYLYGNLTIEQYKNVVGLDHFALEIDLHEGNGKLGETVSQFFDEEYEKTEVFNIISFGPQPLLCKILDSDTCYDGSIYASTIEKTFKVVQKDIIKNAAKMSRATIVDSMFNFATFWGSRAEFVVYMDYYLYRETNEIDSQADYFGVKTRVWVDNEYGSTDQIQTKYSLPGGAGDIMEAAPETQSAVGTLNVSIGFGASPGGTIGYSIDFSNMRPNINQSLNLNTDVVEWSLTPRTWLPLSIDEAVLTCCATWATSNLGQAGIDLYYGASIDVGSSSAASGYTKVPVRYTYPG